MKAIEFFRIFHELTVHLFINIYKEISKHNTFETTHNGWRTVPLKDLYFRICVLVTATMKTNSQELMIIYYYNMVNVFH